MIVGATAVNAVFVLSIQILGLVALRPAEFGFFSIQYLFFALASSVCLSVICEPWLRTEVHDELLSSWEEYSSALVYLSLSAGALTAIVSALIPGLRGVALWGAIAVAAGTYRTGTRYYQVRSGMWRQVLRADVLGFLLTVVAWLLLFQVGVSGLVGLTVAWAVGVLGSALFSRLPAVRGPGSIAAWVSTHRRHIGPLLRDSTLMDLGAIGTPFVVAPLMGIANFGVYRAVSNVAAPVRLVLNPLRPTLAGAPLASHRSRKRVVASIVVSIAFGLAAWAALLLIGAASLGLGSLSAVVAFAAPTALFVTANFFGHFYYIIARTHSGGNAMLIGRLIQTVLAIGRPIAGVIVTGLPGAIWAYAFATTVSSISWFAIVMRSARPRR